MIQRFLVRLALVITGSLCLVGTAAAAAANNTSVQSYSADTKLQFGTIVQLAGNNGTKVAPATFKDINQMYGVAVDPGSLSFTVSGEGLTNQTYVATSGTYRTLVSNQNGGIKQGDYVTLSAIDGVGMKANEDQPIILGRAGGAFDGKNNTIGTVQLKDTEGKEAKTVTLATIPVVIDIRHNPNEKSTKANVPRFLQRLGEAVAEKPVGPLRIYLSIAITGISLIAAIVILYAGVRNSLIAIGRNPLSKKSVFRGLLEIILTSVIVLIVGLFAVYLLLKL